MSTVIKFTELLPKCVWCQEPLIVVSDGAIHANGFYACSVLHGDICNVATL